jgi:ADP-heptose:LPS heptosyltransferase
LKKNPTKNIKMRLLIIRTSAMGDVALTTPVLRAVSLQYPDLEMVLLTRPAFKPFFHLINGLNLFSIDLKFRHKGFPGLIRLFRDLSSTGKFDIVIDLHDVLRSQVLRSLFRLKGVQFFVIDKGRGEKREVITGKKKTRVRHTVERYSDTFTKAGFPVKLTEGPWIVPSPDALSKIASLTAAGDVLNIGVAPYARHKLKMWPEEYMLRLLKMISEKHRVKFFLFGGEEESQRLNNFQEKLSNSHNTAGKLNLDEEMALMSRLDLMIAMDSSNMHMAALLAVKVVSIWGGTDPLCGFGAWQQPEEYSISIPNDQLTCHPCTVFGTGECRRGDLACMNWLTPEIVFKRINRLNIL